MFALRCALCTLTNVYKHKPVWNMHIPTWFTIDLLASGVWSPHDFAGAAVEPGAIRGASTSGPETQRLSMPVTQPAPADPHFLPPHHHHPQTTTARSAGHWGGPGWDQTASLLVQIYLWIKTKTNPWRLIFYLTSARQEEEEDVKKKRNKKMIWKGQMWQKKR